MGDRSRSAGPYRFAVLVLSAVALGSGLGPSIRSDARAATAIGAAAAPVAAQNPPTPGLALDAPARVAAGRPITLGMRIVGAPRAAGYEVAVRFAQGAARFAGTFLGDAESPDDGSGTAIAGPRRGSLNLAVFRCTSSTCPPGSQADGPLRPLEVRLLPMRTGRQRIEVRLLRLVDIAGRDIAIGPPERSVTVQVGGSSAQWGPAAGPSSATATTGGRTPEAGTAEADVTGNGRIEFSDLAGALIAWQHHRERESECPAQRSAADVDRSGCIDVADLVRVANAPAPAPASTAARARLVPTRSSDLLVVDSTSDATDHTIGDGVCATATGTCSLRAAIHEANALPGAQTIRFAIPGTGVHTIRLTSALPAISDMTGGLAIDGYSQPGATPNTDPLASNAKILVEIRGNGALGFEALTVTSAYNLIRGLAVYDALDAVWLHAPGAHHNVLVGNFLGTNAAGTFGAGEDWLGGHGVHVSLGANQNLIGRPDPADRNVISGNAYVGIRFDHRGTSGNVVRNNIIGLAPSGRAAVPNLMGIDLQWGASSNIIGGLGAYEHNVISGQPYAGVDLSHGASTTNNHIVGNFIGTNLAGDAVEEFSRTGNGIVFKDDPVNNYVYANVIGGTRDDAIWHKHDYTGRNYIFRNYVGVATDGITPLPNDGYGMYLVGHDMQVGPGNIFANNALGGIFVDGAATDRNAITRNRFLANGGLAIDLAPAGPTANDSVGHVGPNQNLNTPVLSTVSATTAVGTACRSCTVEIYRADPAWTGPGTSGRAPIDAAGADPATGAFSAAFAALEAGDSVTAIAIDPNGNTSEFAPARPVGASGLSANPPAAAGPVGPVGPIGPIGTDGTDGDVPRTGRRIRTGLDGFSRSFSETWGYSDDGVYVMGPTESANRSFSVHGGKGVIAVPADASREAIQPGILVANVSVSAEIAVDRLARSRSDLMFLLRHGMGGDGYRAGIRILPNGTVRARVVRNAGVSSAEIANRVVPGLRVEPGRAVMMRAEVLGADPVIVRVRVWSVDQVEPTAWAAIATDRQRTLTEPGTIGISAALPDREASIRVSIDNLAVSRL